MKEKRLQDFFWHFHLFFSSFSSLIEIKSMHHSLEILVTQDSHLSLIFFGERCLVLFWIFDFNRNNLFKSLQKYFLKFFKQWGQEWVREVPVITFMVPRIWYLSLALAWPWSMSFLSSLYLSHDYDHVTSYHITHIAARTQNRHCIGTYSFLKIQWEIPTGLLDITWN